MMHRRSGGQAVGRSVPLITVVLSVVTACTPSGRPAARPPGSSDSAGITIIDNAAPLWTAGHGWAVGESALVDIGTLGAPQTALRLSDGRIVVADGRPIGLRYFSATGRELYTVGGREDGQGALQSLYHLDLGHADTIVAFDLSQHRAVLYDPNGAYAGSAPVAPGLTPAGSNGFLPKGLAPDGRYLLQRDEAPFPFPGAAWSLRTDSTRIFWLSRSGTLTDSSARLVAGELFGFPVKAQQGEILMTPLARPLAPALHVAGGRDRVWISDAKRWEVQGLDANGAVERVVRLALPIAVVTPQIRDSFVARFRARVAAANGNMLQRQFAAGIAGAPFADRFPAFSELLVGEDSTLWMLHLGLEEEGPTTWSVVGADGRWLGEVLLPTGLRVTAIGHGWILGIQDGHVRLYPLVER